ncbi:hypothetical protein P7C73_g2550, partial [Tremellales sp. Uapishka_1]
MFGWSLPKYTGTGPWNGNTAVEASHKLWGGTVSQRERWNGEMDSHLLPEDYESPVAIAPPCSKTFLESISRPKQSSAFANLPETILLDIALHNIALHDMNDENPPNQLLSSDTISNLDNLLKTCSAAYHLSIPTETWKLLIYSSVKQFIHNLMGRWRANPSGVGPAASLGNALEESFLEPVQKVIREQAAGDMEGVTGRDIYKWWKYSLGWRSRRRVWYCVVHGCSTARDSDWW